MKNWMNKKALQVFALAFISTSSYAQTANTAQEYIKPTLKCAFATGIPESSALVYTDGKLWTLNDKSGTATIYSVDTSNGTILQTVHVDNYPNTDWEDMTSDKDYIYIGDFGNNEGSRTDLKVLKIKKSDIGKASDVHVKAEAISFSYTDQKDFASTKTHNFDCEAILSMGNSLYLFTKDRGDLQTRVYKLPKKVGTYPIASYTSFNANGLITGADYDPVKNEVVLIGYFKKHLKSFIWVLSDFTSDQFFSGNKRRIEIGDEKKEWQTEGICYRSPGKLFISSEAGDEDKASLYSLSIK
jgi:hypothetical protein